MKIRLSLGAAALLALLLSSQAQSQECSFSTVADVVFLVDGSSSVGRPNFKYIRNFISAAAGAFQIGEDKTRVGVVQYSGDAQTEFNLNQHFARPALLRAIGSLPYKEGNTMTASAAGKKLTVSDETERSMKVTWTPAPGKVTHYRLKYVPSGGGKEVVQKSPSTSTFMRRLQPMTTYNITVHPIYKRGEGKARQGVGTTHTQCKTTAKADLVLLVDGSWSIGRINFKTIRNFIGRMVSVFDISPDRVQIGLAQYSGDPKTEWHLNAHPTKESLLEAIASLPYKGGNTRTGLALNYILQNNFRPNVGLRPDSRKIGILITDGKSQDEIILSSQNLRDSGIELYAIGVENADENELRSIASDPDEIHMYNVNKFQFLLDIVDDLTVNLCNSVKGPGGELEAATNLVTSEVTHRSFRATWTAPDSPVDTYRVTYMTVAGGPTQELLVDGSVTTVVLEGLTPLTEYLVNVYSVVGEQSSEPLNGTETTLPLPFAGVLRITDVTHSTMKLNWDAAPGAVLKYIITYKPEEGDLKEVEVGGDITSLDLSSLISQTEYDVAVTPIYNTGPGNPMLGTAITDTQCKTTAKADLVLLVDGSWSIGYMNFRTIRNFIGRMVSVFDISPDRVQIGLAQYSGDPKTEWHLNAHPTKESLLEAIASLPYKGGNTRTGLALNYILQNNFRPNVGLRPDSRKIGILITDGKSQDEIILSSQNLRDSGIELYAIGVENADENELRSIASDPDEIHMYNVNKFQFLLDIVDDLTVNLCNSVKGPGGELKAATNLVTSEVTHRSFRATWTAPDSPVDTYRVTYMTVAGGPTQELLVDGSVTTVVLEGLTPLTEYLVNVYSVVGEQSSEPLNGTETTLPLPFAGVLRITDVTHSTMKLNWDAAPGAVLKYIITYKPEEGDLKEVEVGGDITSLDLSSLISQTEYDVAVTPIYNTGPGNPMLGTAITDVVPAPKNLKFSEVAQTSFRATWEHGAPDVALYRISWTKRGDTNTQFAILNSDETSHVLQNLDPDTEYSVTVTAIYPDESESEDLMGSHHILTQ